MTEVEVEVVHLQAPQGRMAGIHEMLTVQAEIEVELKNENGPSTFGDVTIHVRLRR